MSDDGHATYLVDAATCNPIELRTRGEGGGASLRFAIRVQLPGTDKNLQTLASRRRTPDAQVDTDPGRYDEALTRLSPRADGGSSRCDAQARRSRGCAGARRGRHRTARGRGPSRTAVSRRALHSGAKRRGFISMVSIGR